MKEARLSLIKRAMRLIVKLSGGDVERYGPVGEVHRDNGAEEGGRK